MLLPVKVQGGEELSGMSWRYRLLGGAVLFVLTAVAPSTASAGSISPPAPPTSTPAPSVPFCAGAKACTHSVLAMINHARALGHLAALSFAPAQSNGDRGCLGSYGHSAAMARSGVIWHVNSRFPRASFPRNICLPYRTAGENVGLSSTGNELDDLLTINHLMMQEPHTAAVCAVTVNHACNILNRAYRHIGIGVYMAGGVTWLTEDFIG